MAGRRADVDKLALLMSGGDVDGVALPGRGADFLFGMVSYM